VALAWFLLSWLGVGRSNKPFHGLAVVALVALGAGAAEAHDLRIATEQLRREASRLEKNLALFRERPVLPSRPSTPEEQRWALGDAEVERALGRERRALEMLLARVDDPEFQKLPEYVAALLMVSELLEKSAEDPGAMAYAELALREGGSREEMAEAGARWFRVARRAQRLDRRAEIYRLWQERGGEKAAGTERAAEVMFQVAFGLRADRDFEGARALIRRVPAESAFGSRAAYLGGVLLVEAGDLSNAERWFAALMDWPMPERADDDPTQQAIERETRELAALSAGRLRFERGDVDGADAAYRRVGPGSPYEGEACWERAYLDLERGRRRGALARVQCVVDLGAGGARHVDAKLFKASLLAHLERYADSIEAYGALHRDLLAERDLFTAALAATESASRVLFEGMERSAERRGRDATPGPATLYADAWTPEVDRAYRVDRGLAQSASDVEQLLAEIDGLEGSLRAEGSFAGLELRRRSLEDLIREARHLEGHAGQMAMQLRGRHASADGALHEHADEAGQVEEVVEALRRLAAQAERDLVELERERGRRIAEATADFSDLRGQLRALGGEAGALRVEAAPPVEQAARAAMEATRSAIADAAMRAEFGVLDTYWLKKEHRTRAVEALLADRDRAKARLAEALTSEEDTEEAAPDEVPEPMPAAVGAE
jgi:hypothetical protein